jgi:type IV secretion system protein VirB10
MTPAPDPITARLRLRGRPTPAVRLSRKVLIGASCALGVVVGGAVMIALQPPSAKSAKPAEPPAAARNKPVADRLNALPKDYSDVPRLGPPLPGDLGKAILTSERSLSAAGPADAAAPSVPPAAGSSSAGPGANTATHSAVAPASANAYHAHAIARTSPLFASPKAPVSTSSDATTVNPPSVPVNVGDLQSVAGASNSMDDQAKSPQEKQNAFLNGSVDRIVVSPDRLQPAISPYVLQAGAIIPAALMTGLRSDLPGEVIAQVTQDVYDSLTGRYLLIPQGSRLIGQYDNAVAFGQSRVLLAWSRLILPDGRSIVLERLSAADSQGFAGLTDHTDYHWAGVMQATALSTLLSIGADAGSSNTDSDIVRALHQGASDSISQAGRQMVERQLNIQPTLTIRPGFPVRVILTRDLVLEPYGG